jgi:hypothetical protein
MYEDLSEYFEYKYVPEWYGEAVQYLRGAKDEGLFGLYLYNLIREVEGIATVINIGTARGHSAVCAAKGLVDSNRDGEVHTIDVIPSDIQRSWGANSDNDPVGNDEENWSIRDLVSRLHSPSDDKVQIKFHTGNSSDILSEINVSPDLVFHDGRHTYDTVKTDMKLVRQLSNDKLIQVHDDCHLFNVTRELSIYNPKNQSKVANLPLIRRTRLARYIRNYGYSFIERPFPGVIVAVEEYLNQNDIHRTEIISDEVHAPITAIWECKN